MLFYYFEKAISFCNLLHRIYLPKNVFCYVLILTFLESAFNDGIRHDIINFVSNMGVDFYEQFCCTKTGNQ